MWSYPEQSPAAATTHFSVNGAGGAKLRMPAIGLGSTSKVLSKSATVYLQNGGRHLDTAQMYLNYDQLREAIDQIRKERLQMNAVFKRLQEEAAADEDDEDVDEAAGGDGVGSAQPGGPAECGAVHAEPAQAPAGTWAL